MKCNLQKAALTFLMFMFSVAVYSQNQRTCGTTAYMQEKMQDPVFAKKQQLQNLKFKKAFEKIKSGNHQARMATLQIPVAVHFPEGSEADRACLEALAQSQIDVLNQDYTATNADIANWAAASSFYPGTNTGAFDVEFVIATRNHPANTDDDLVEGGPAVSIGYNFGNGNDQDIKWAGYKNFLIKTLSGGTLGYSPLGGSIANGSAVVMSPSAFGSDNIASGCTSNGVNFIPGAPYNLGRTVTHELGHFFTLNHTFNGGCAGNNDGYNDTPAISGPNYGCPAAGSVNACVAGEKALTMNYMDYTNDACMYMFSQDQIDAVQAYWIVTEPDLLTDVLTADYVLLFDEEELNVCEGNTMQYTFDYDADNSFSTQVDFTYSVNPAGPTIVFSQDNATVDTADITATVNGATAGNYTVTITGTYGSEVQNYTLDLNVYNSVLNAPTPVSPGNGATDVVNHTLTWTADPNASSYNVNIYDDPTLMNLVENATVQTNSYTATGLAADTVHYWTVTASNTACSVTSPVSSTFNFHTANIECNTIITSDASIVIPAGVGQPGEGAPAVQTINYTNGVTITDVNVTINITHPWVEDLRLVLTSPTGTQLVLFANIIGEGINFTNTVLDDQAATLLSDATGADAPYTGAYQPDNALSVFNGEISSGNWTLSVYDFWDTDSGTLENWSIEICGEPLPDADADGVPDSIDNCVNTPNSDQADWNNDGQGDVCDDTDNDTILDSVDNCVENANTDQADTDNDGVGDVCDNCIDTANADQADADADGVGDVCDNCPNNANPGQEDMENDGVGDACQVYDADADGILDDVDNCVDTPNPNQADTDNDGVGDVCDNCINTANADQADVDADGVGDACDNCPDMANTDQADWDANGIGDICQDIDNDGVLDNDDNCVNTPNTDQLDANNDGVGDICESIIPADTVTPNGDFQNDTWHIENIEYQTSNTVKVFNRWGVKVFDASNYVNDSWGAESSEGGSGLLPSGSYYFVIEYVTGDGEAKTTTGWMYINY